ncbi:endonuclease V [Ferruginibacter sp.]|nr:endonuclease V [Ferruginibacter sp.]
MLLAIDVYYKEQTAKAVGVLFNWDSAMPEQIIIEHSTGVEEYVPGEFYKRELPCVLKIIGQIKLDSVEAIIIDGYIYVDNDGAFGLGGVLYETINKSVPVIGVAKTSFFRNKETVTELLRGESKNPLYISSIGYPIDDAVERIKNMKGEFRIPAILKELDRITKE